MLWQYYICFTRTLWPVLSKLICCYPCRNKNCAPLYLILRALSWVLTVSSVLLVGENRFSFPWKNVPHCVYDSVSVISRHNWHNLFCSVHRSKTTSHLFYEEPLMFSNSASLSCNRFLFFFITIAKTQCEKKGYLDLFQCLIQAVMCCWNYYEFSYKWCHHLSILKVNQTHTHTVTTGGKLITTTHFQAKLPFNKSKRLRGKTHNQELRNSNITTFTVKQVEMFFFSFFCPFQTWNT